MEQYINISTIQVDIKENNLKTMEVPVKRTIILHVKGKFYFELEKSKHF